MSKSNRDKINRPRHILPDAPACMSPISVPNTQGHNPFRPPRSRPVRFGEPVDTQPLQPPQPPFKRKMTPLRRFFRRPIHAPRARPEPTDRGRGCRQPLPARLLPTRFPVSQPALPHRSPSRWQGWFAKAPPGRRAAHPRFAPPNRSGRRRRANRPLAGFRMRRSFRSAWPDRGPRH